MPSTPKTKVPVPTRRSACDQCRAKRVRCLRAANSTATCARCSYIGAQCVTGSPGHPGRPRKSRLATHSDGDGVADGDDNGDGHGESASENTDQTATSISSPAVHHSRFDQLSSAHRAQPEFWHYEADITFPLASPSGQDMPALLPVANVDRPHDLDPLLYMGRHANSTLNMNIDPLPDPFDGFLLRSSPDPGSGPGLLSRCGDSAGTALMRFREDMVQRIASLDEYFSDPFQVLHGCQEEGAETNKNQVAILLTCSKEFTDIIQSLAAAETTVADALSTESVLLALSSYLALMRLYDSLFYCIYKFLSQMPRGSFKSVKVKSVLRIGCMASLQDVPLKTYATGILDVVRGQVRTLERCMGVSTEYCLSDEGDAAAISFSAASPGGLLSRPDRARLLSAAMAQGDVKSRRGCKSYVESIRASIKESLALLED